MDIKLFVKTDCPRCPAAKRACDGIDEVQVFDIGDMDGLAEAAFHGVLATPTTLVIDSSGNEIASWRGDAPDRSELLRLIAQ